MADLEKEYTIQLSSKAQKDLKKLTPQIRKKILPPLQALSTNRTLGQFKTLKGRKFAQFRLRVGDYRILYDVYDEDLVVLILRIGNRKEIYR